MTLYRLNVKQPKLICLIILSAFAAMGAVLMTPALPSIAEYFSAQYYFNFYHSSYS